MSSQQTEYYIIYTALLMCKWQSQQNSPELDLLPLTYVKWVIKRKRGFKLSQSVEEGLGSEKEGENTDQQAEGCCLGHLKTATMSMGCPVQKFRGKENTTA